MSFENLKSILSFVEESILKDQKSIRRLSDYSASISFPEAELRELINVQFNQIVEGTPAWLKVARVAKTKPPRFPISTGNQIDAGELVASPDWVSVDDDPNKSPSLKQSIRKTLSNTIVERLLRDGRLQKQDVYRDSADGNSSTAVVRREKFPEVDKLFQAWLDAAWLPWSEREKPVRRAATFYEELFRIHTAISGRDLPIEVVVGVGVVRGQIAGHPVDHPLIEYSVFLEVSASSGEILVRPKPRPPELFEFETDDLTGDSATLRKKANEHWTTLGDHVDASPFEREHWEAILRSAAVFLRSGGVYEEAGETRRVKPADAGLVVYDTWVLFTRPVSVKPMITDIRSLKDALVEAGEEVDPLLVLLDDPKAAEGLQSTLPDRVTEMLREAFGNAASASRSGSRSSSGRSRSDEAESVAPYFPRVSNAEQERIIQILERPESKGLVVQGPPGTGKSHSIANIICHGLSRGWRILVTAHSDGPLQVLRNMLPPSVRDLAVNLSAAEQSEVLQLEASVKAISAIPGRVGNRSERIKKIEEIEQQITSDRRRLDEIRVEVLTWARTNLERQKTYAGNLSAGELAERIVQDRQAHAWLPDSIPFESMTPPLGEEQVAQLRTLRAKAGVSLIARDWKLPEAVEVVAASDLSKIHHALREYDELGAGTADGPVPHLAGIENGRSVAEELLQYLGELKNCLTLLREDNWVLKYVGAIKAPTTDDGLLALSVSEVFKLFQPLIEAERNFVLNQVQATSLDGPELGRYLQKAAQTGRAYSTLPFIRPPAEVISSLDAIRVRGEKPQTKEDWSLVSEHDGWRREIVRVANRWNAVAEMFDLGRAPTADGSGLQWMKRNLVAIGKADELVKVIWPEVTKRAAQIDRGGLGTADITLSSEAIENALNWLEHLAAMLKARIAQVDVAWAREKLGQIQRRMKTFDSPSVAKLRSLLESVGQPDCDLSDLTEKWDAVLVSMTQEAEAKVLVRQIDAMADAVEAAGAPKWAAQIRSVPNKQQSGVPFDSSDPILPNQWKDSWIWSAWQTHLQKSSSFNKLRSTMEERARLEQEIRTLMNEVVGLRTELQLSRMPSSILNLLQQFQTAISRIGAGTGVRANRHRREARSLSQQCASAVPCWIMPLHKVAETQPSQLSIFDLVILDEASQCGPEAIIALMRSKKALIVGDDKQVMPTSFLSEEYFRALKAKYLDGTSYAGVLAPGSSFYDLALAMFAGQNVMLREHFRCVEPIIRFSMQFYGDTTQSGSLVPLKVPKSSERLDPPLIDIYVPHGRAVRQTNVAEAEIIVKEIERISTDDAYAGKTIGVVSLSGSEQPQLIERLLQERVGANVFAKHDIVVSDSAGLQGKERSIIFLSMVDAPNRRSAARTQALYAQRYNVALSRAKDRMYLVRSLRMEDVPNQSDLRRRAIAHFADPMPAGVKPVVDRESLELRCDSGFERQVLRRLLDLDYHVIPQVPAAGYSIDMVVEGEGDRRLAIELDGDIWHPPSKYSEDLARQQALERIGFKFWRCWWSDWILDPEECFSDLVRALNNLGIEPKRGQVMKPHLFVSHLIADVDGNLWTENEYSFRAQSSEESSDVFDGAADPAPTNGELLLLSGDRAVGRALGENQAGQARLASPRPRSSLIVVGDLITVECSGAPDLKLDGKRTFEIRPGATDDIERGFIGIDSELGELLRDLLIDDAVTFPYRGNEVTLIVVGVHKRT